MIYYDKDGYIVRDSHHNDTMPLSLSLRDSDVQEIWASDHKLPLEALRIGFEQSSTCLTIQNCKPLAMFGTVKMGDGMATIWLLSDEDLYKKSIEFVKYSKHFVELLFSKNPDINKMCNYVDARNTASIKWLKFIGAKISPAEPYGIEQKLFHYFSFERK